MADAARALARRSSFTSLLEITVDDDDPVDFVDDTDLLRRGVRDDDLDLPLLCFDGVVVIFSSSSNRPPPPPLNDE